MPLQQHIRTGRFLILLLVLPFTMSCWYFGTFKDAPGATTRVGASSSKAQTTAYRTNGRLRTNAGTAYVGHLVANTKAGWATPSQYCLENGLLYKGADYRLGRTNVFLQGPIPKGAINSAVIVYGTRVKGLDRKLKESGPCPPPEEDHTPQMRSDWTSDEADRNGHTTRARLAETVYIEATRIEPLPLVTATPMETTGRNLYKKNTVLKVTNVFDRPLPSNVEFAFYYEGGSGKPMPKFEPQDLGELSPGESKLFLAPIPQKTSRRSRTNKWVFRGYRLKGKIGDVELNLLITL
ncbi:MAG: hypothetical protein CMH54_00715 [Myxococcales bacterium]|nr:hypothetical protein [Myxococcales bacterium]